MGSFASLNPARISEDDPASIQTNLRILAEAIGIPPARIFMPHQTHHDRWLEIDEAFLTLDKPEQTERLEGVDALFTHLPGICVSVSTADCVPVLMYAPDRQIVAAIHAGWRGCVQGITQKVARHLIQRHDCDPAA